MINVGTGFVVAHKTWQELKEIIAVKKLALQHEYDSLADLHELFAIDDVILYHAIIYGGSVPPTSGVSQAQNDADLAELQSTYMATANGPLRAQTNDGVRLLALDAPRARDKKPVVTLFPATDGLLTWLCGAADDPNPPPGETGRGTGMPFLIEFGPGDVPTTKGVEFTFSEPLEVHDGQVMWGPSASWSFNDRMSLGIRIASSSAVPNTASMGDCVKVAVAPGAHMYVPAVSGTHDMIVPRPIEDKAGAGAHWNVDYFTGAVAPASGSGSWNLYDFDVSSWYIRNVSLMHPGGVLDIDVYKSEYYHPSWRLYWEVTKTTPGSGSVGGWIMCFRRNVT